MPKITLEERRLQILRQQLSGKSSDSNSKKNKESSVKVNYGSALSQSISRIPTNNSGSNDREDVSYMYGDLKKVLILSILAIALQGALFLGLQMRLFHLWY